MRDTGCVLSALYPFRPSFYERFGYVGLPRARTVTFSPADSAGLMRKELPGEVDGEMLAAVTLRFAGSVRPSARRPHHSSPPVST